MKSIRVIDPNLSAVGGHYFEFDRALYEAASDRGVSCEIWTTQAFQRFKDILPSRPVFSGGPHIHSWMVPRVFSAIRATLRRHPPALSGADSHLHGGSSVDMDVRLSPWRAGFVRSMHRLNDLLNAIWYNRITHRDLSTAMTRNDVGGHIWLFSYLTFDELVAVAMAIRQLPPHTSSFIYLSPTIARYELPFGMSRLCFWWLERLARSRSITLFVDWERAYQKVTRLTRLPVLMIPFIMTSFAALQTAPALRIHDGPPHYVVLGGAREGKGFAVLVEALKRMGGDLQEYQLRFTIQCFWAEPSMEHAVADLKELARRYPGIGLVDYPLESEHYYALLRTADAVILPYTPTQPNSGVAAEAMAAGTPIITTAGSWVAAQITHYGNGVVFEARNPVSLAETIRGFSSRPRVEPAELERRRRAFLAENNPQVLLDIMLGDS